MLVRLLLMVLLAAGLVSAQRGGGGSGGDEGGGMGGGRGGGGDMGAAMPQVRRLSKTEMLFEKLKLNKDQKEAAQTILSATTEKAAPTRDLLNKGRQVIANAMLRKATEDDIKKLMGEYAAVSATMTGIEAEAFGKIYALLKPNQQSKAPQAFDLMAGMFAGSGMGGGMARGRGQGRGEGRN
jgi:uncharacterized sporulation protein YeaH/YhbH (DUF444 family)